MFKPISEVATQDLVFQVADQSANSMSDQRLVEIMQAAPLVRKLLDDAGEELLRRIKDEHKYVAGVKLVNGRGSKAWSIPEDQVAEKLVKLGMPKTETHVTKLISPAQALKAVWQKRDGTVMQFNKRQIEVIEKEYITKLAGALTVVPESDPRAAVVTDAAPLFSAVSAPVVHSGLPAFLTLRK